MRRFLSLGLSALLLAAGTSAWALYAEHGAWQKGHDISASFWPEGAKALANRKERVGGHMLNAFDWFRYQGNAEDFNRFLTDLDRVDGPKSLTLMVSHKKPNITEPYWVDADWTMSISSNSHCGAQFPVDGRIKLSSVKLPKNLPVWAEEDAPAAIKTLVQEHEKQRPKLKGE